MIAKKRLLSILVAVLMVFGMMPMTAGMVYAEDLEPITVMNECGDDGNAVIISNADGESVSNVPAGSNIVITFIGGSQLDPEDPNYNDQQGGSDSSGRPVYLIITANADGSELLNEVVGHNQMESIMVPAGGVKIRLTYGDADAVISPDNFTDYFDVNEDVASLKETITNDTIIFRGDFTETFENPLFITIDRTVKIEGDQAFFKNVAFEVTANDVSISGLSITDTRMIHYAFDIRNCEGVVLTDNEIDYTSVNEGLGFSSAVITENANNLTLNNNRIRYIGKTNGEFINSALWADSSENIDITNNTFDITLVSAAVKWGTDYTSAQVSEGLKFDGCHALKVSGNDISVKYDGIIGAYDTIYGIDIKGSGSSEAAGDTADILINDNTISVSGHTYAYGLLLSASDFLISDNEFHVETDENYAAAIDMEEALSGEISGNSIYTNTSANGIVTYGIYGSYISTPAENLMIENNEFILQSKITYGIEIAGSIAEGKTLSVKDNIFREEGDYLAGIAVDAAGELSLIGNIIDVPGSNENEYSLWDAFFSKWRTSYGIGIMDNAGCHASISGNTITSSDAGIISLAASEITNNTIEAGGPYTINVFVENKDTGKAAHISGNTLTAADKTGNSSVYASDADIVENNVDIVENNKPEESPVELQTQTITAANVTKTFGDAAFSLGAKTNGDGTFTYTSSNNKVATVSSAGMVTIKGAGSATITINASATANYKAATKTITITVNKAANPLTVKPKTATVKYNKVKKKKQTIKAKKVFTVSKAQGNVTYKLASVKKAKFKKYFKVSKSGKITVKKGLKKGTYKLKVKVTDTGNANYNPLTKTVTLKIKVK